MYKAALCLLIACGQYRSIVRADEPCRLGCIVGDCGNLNIGINLPSESTITGCSPGPIDTQFYSFFAETKGGTLLVQSWSVLGTLCDAKLNRAQVTAVLTAQANYQSSTKYPCLDGVLGPSYVCAADGFAPSSIPFTPSPSFDMVLGAPGFSVSASPGVDTTNFSSLPFVGYGSSGVTVASALCSTGSKSEFASVFTVDSCGSACGCMPSNPRWSTSKMIGSGSGTASLVRSYELESCGPNFSLTWNYNFTATNSVMLSDGAVVQFGGVTTPSIAVARDPAVSSSPIHVSSFLASGSVVSAGTGFTVGAASDGVGELVRQYSITRQGAQLFLIPGTIVIPDAPSVSLAIAGDMDLDGAMTYTDRTLLAEAIEGINLSFGSQILADINKDGAVTETDYSLFVGTFELQGCPYDMNGDSAIDGSDFVLFINAFSSSSLVADISGSSGAPDGVVDGSDFVGFVNGFSSGVCP